MNYIQRGRKAGVSNVILFFSLEIITVWVKSWIFDVCHWFGSSSSALMTACTWPGVRTRPDDSCYQGNRQVVPPILMGSRSEEGESSWQSGLVGLLSPSSSSFAVLWGVRGLIILLQCPESFSTTMQTRGWSMSLKDGVEALTKSLEDWESRALCDFTRSSVERCRVTLGWYESAGFGQASEAIAKYKYFDQWSRTFYPIGLPKTLSFQRRSM